MQRGKQPQQPRSGTGHHRQQEQQQQQQQRKVTRVQIFRTPSCMCQKESDSAIKRRTSDDFGCQASTLSEYILQKATCSTEGFKIMMPSKRVIGQTNIQRMEQVVLPKPKKAQVEDAKKRVTERKARFKPDGYTKAYLESCHK